MADQDLIPVSWDSHNINDGTNLESGFAPGIEWGLPSVGIQQVNRLQKWPLIASVTRPGRTLDLQIRILNSDVRLWRDRLELWFSPEDEDPKLLVVEDEDGSTDRYVQGICETFEPMVVGGRACNDAFVFTIRVHADVRWRKVTTTTTAWNIAASGDTTVITNAGSDDAYPILTIEPTAAKDTGVPLYNSFITSRWRTSEAFTKYPIDIVNNTLDTDALIKTGTTTTLSGNLLAGAVTVNLTDASSFPSNGMAYITDAAPGDEQVSWTSKAGNQLVGVTRGIGGTSDDAHTGGDTIAVSKMLANGDDIIIEVDGVSVDRWLQDIDTATTQIWCNIDFTAKVESEIEEEITAIQSVTSITVDDSITKAPDEGLLVVNTEIFSYTSKNNADKQFLGITRSVNGSTAGAHTAGDTIWWCQHSIWLRYGDEDATTPTQDDDYKPMMSLASTNIIWTYTDWGKDSGTRTGQWQQSTSWGSPVFYGGTQGSTADPWSDPGVTSTGATKGRYKLFNPCEITNVNITNGEKRSTSKSNFIGAISSYTGRYWEAQYTIPDPAGDDAWEAWSQNQAITSGRTQVSFVCQSSYTSVTNDVEASDVVITLNNSKTPVIVIIPEQNIYSIGTTSVNATLYNQSTSTTLGIDYGLALNQELEIDTDDKTVKDKRDDSSQFKAITLTGGARRDWFKLRPGTNTLTYTDIGTTGVTITFEYEERNF